MGSAAATPTILDRLADPEASMRLRAAKAVGWMKASGVRRFADGEQQQWVAKREEDLSRGAGERG